MTIEHIMYVCFLHACSFKNVALERLLPAMTADKIPDDDRHWINYLLLLKIMQYLFAPAISKEECHYFLEVIWLYSHN